MPPGRLVNAAAVCAEGRVLGGYHKRLLPNYGVFDEQRWFAPGEGPPTRYVVAGVPVGVTICEDMWFAAGPMADQAAAGAAAAGQPQRLALLAGPARRAAGRAGRPGGRDRLPHRLREPGGRPGRAGLRRRLAGDGGRRDAGGLGGPVRPRRCWWPTSTSTPRRRSSSADATRPRAGRVTEARARRTATSVAADRLAPVLDPEAEVYEALVLGTRDYVAQERLHRRGDRAVRRDRLVPGGGHRRRRPGPRATCTG